MRGDCRPTPLWQPKDQAARLSELLSSEPLVKEAPLRRDVRLLGRLLGDVLKEQAGPSLYEAVEELRQISIQQREILSGEMVTQPEAAEPRLDESRAEQIIAQMTVTEA